MPSYNIELNNKPVFGSNEHALLLRITVDRKHTRIRLEYVIHPKHFNPSPKQNLYVRNSHKKHKLINEHIEEKIQEAKNTVNALKKEGNLISAKNIKRRIVKPMSANIIAFAESLVKNMQLNNKIGNSKKYKVLIKKLRNFQGGNDLTFQEVNLSFLNSFQTYLGTLNNNLTTINSNFRTLRSIYYKGIEEGIVKQENNPFFSFKLKLGPVTRTRLNEDEIKAIVELELPKDSLIWHIKNAFLFSFYNAGIRASDLITMQWKNVADGRLTYKMQKTQKVHSVKLLDKPKHILDYYASENPEHYIFPFFKNDIDYSDPLFLHNQISAKTALLNKYLKLIATKAGIHKNISTHTARHSFADIARKKTDNLYNLSKTLGHSSLKITEAYLASFDEDAIDDTLNNVFN